MFEMFLIPCVHPKHTFGLIPWFFDKWLGSLYTLADRGTMGSQLTVACLPLSWYHHHNSLNDIDEWGGQVKLIIMFKPQHKI